MVVDSPPGVASGTANGGCPKGGVAHTEHQKLGGQAIQVEADAVEVGVGGASGQGRSHRILRGCILRHRFLGWVQQDGIDVGQFAEHPQKSREFRGRAGPHRSCDDFVLNRWIRLQVEGIKNT